MESTDGKDDDDDASPVRKKAPPKNIYRECCLFDKDKCSQYKNERVEYKGLMAVDDLTGSVEKHLRNLHFKENLKLFGWTEKSLIENRLGRHFQPEEKLCPYHRFSLGVTAYVGRQCCHPLHEKVKQGQKAAKTTRISLTTLQKMNSQNKFAYKVGGFMCKKHSAMVTKSFTEVEEEEEEPMDFEIEPIEFIDDMEYIPPVFVIDDERVQQTSAAASQVAMNFEVSPIRHKIRKSIATLNDKDIQYYKKKRTEWMEAAERMFDENVAPGQSQEEVRKAFDQPLIPKDLQPLLDNYAESDKFGKLVILSLVNHDKYSREQLMNIFNCSKRQVDEARSMRSSQVGVFQVEKKKFTRNRLNTHKCEHFLNFIFASGLIQDVAYGTTNIKFDSGDVQSIPHAILQTRFSHTIDFYIDSCKDMNFSPLSRTTLYKILKAINPSQRRSLAGLDDVTAEAMNGFDFLQKTAKELKFDKSLSNNLEKAKRYLKTNYQGHCSTESPIKTHNTAFALSFPKEEPSLQVNDDVCSDCLNVTEVLQQFLDIAEDGSDEDLQYDIKLAVKNIVAYMKHQIRDQQQKQAKIDCFQKITNIDGLWLKDYAQKILPMLYREGQRSYFGKKGMTLHIDVFYIKSPDGQLIKIVYLTLVFRCDQSKLETMNISDHVLREFSLDFPDVTALFAKSDNASSYHGNQILDNLYHLCKKHNLKLIRYDYNEPCRGKDQCDRESSACKTVINSYVQSGNDVKTAEDVYDALHYGAGVKDSKACVLQIDSEQSCLTGPAIDGISSYHSIVFYEQFMKLYRYYNIGCGKVVKYSKESKFVSSYVVKKEFHKTSSVSRKSRKRKSTAKSVLFCDEPNCNAIFETGEELNQHMVTGVHDAVKHSSTLDKVRSSFVYMMKVSSAEHQVCASTNVNMSDRKLKEACAKVQLMKDLSNQGWAIPKREFFRFSKEQEIFLFEQFDEGQRTGKKKSPEEVEKLMRQNFTPANYVTVAQIKAKFNAYTTQLKKNILVDPRTKNCEEGAVEIEYEQLDVANDDDLYQEEIVDATDTAMSAIANWDAGSWVVVKFGRSWYPGVIQEDTTNFEEGPYHVTCMERKPNARNSFKWPSKPDIEWYTREDMLLEIQEVVPRKTEAMTSGEIIWFALDDMDYRDANDSLKRSLREETTDEEQIFP